MEESRVQGKRFSSHLKNNMIHLKKNVYINPADSMYYEKIIRYVDKNDPEAHYHLGLKYLLIGQTSRAKDHLTKSSQIESKFKYKAMKELGRLYGEPDGSKSAANQTGENKITNNISRFIPYALTLLLFLCLFIAALSSISPVRSLFVRAISPSVGMDVIYETTEKPFILYIPYDKSSRDIEKLLYEHTLELGMHSPHMRILLYGIYITSSGQAGEHPIPLHNATMKNQAFVIAEYHAESGLNVKVRFLDTQWSNQRTQNIPYVQLGTNLIRTAIVQYKEDNEELPDTIQELLGNYPANYLSHIPLEMITETSEVNSEYDGTGGWVYEPDHRQIEEIFRPNIPLNIPFYPIEIIVNKEDHSLAVLNGRFIVSEYKVGLGRNGSTQEGNFIIDNRVRNPLSVQPGIYGAAGLAFGKAAIHGTNDEHSIGQDYSMGCVRMLNGDIAQLFALIPKGTQVRIAQQISNMAVNRLSPVHVATMLSNTALDHTETAAHRFNWLH
jgi:lipoprotein-anchoring transpeptidase ErfK/SrfK